jgi:hypothetical protein
MPISGEAVLEDVRRYRTIASLYRQTAAFRPLQRWSLLSQAEEWEQLAMARLDAYFGARDGAYRDPAPRAGRHDARWEILAAA